MWRKSIGHQFTNKSNKLLLQQNYKHNQSYSASFLKTFSRGQSLALSPNIFALSLALSLAFCSALHHLSDYFCKFAEGVTSGIGGLFSCSDLCVIKSSRDATGSGPKETTGV